MHEITNDLKQRQIHTSISTRRTKGEKALLTYCLLLSCTSEVELVLMWADERSYHYPGDGGPNCIQLVITSLMTEDQ